MAAPVHWNVLMKCNYLPQCDQQRLLAAIDPLPSGDTFTIYRGVALPDKQDLRGVSWTFSRDVAKTFASRMYGDGVIYRAPIPRSMVYAYTGDTSDDVGNLRYCSSFPKTTQSAEMMRVPDLHRRHLNESQRDMVAARVANMPHGGDRKSGQSLNSDLDRSAERVAKMLNVSRLAVNADPL